jgi:hypothetical protein
VFGTAAISGLAGIALCALIVGYVARRLSLPVRKTLMWFGLIELDISADVRASERRRR